VIVSRLLSALETGDADTAVACFAGAGSFREAGAAGAESRGARELHAYFSEQLAEGRRIELRPCAVTDDGVRCAMEFNCVRWGKDARAPEPGIGIFERDGHGLLVGGRLYHDIETSLPVASGTARATSSDRPRPIKPKGQP
jgi:hypothetical protein